MPPITWRRRLTDHLMTGVAVLTVVIVLAPLVAIFGYLVYRLTNPSPTTNTV